VLESSFTGETMASALGISPSKNIVRRHLITEFDSLILPSRYAISFYLCSRLVRLCLIFVHATTNNNINVLDIIFVYRKNLSQGIRSGGGVISSYDRHGNVIMKH